MSLGDAAAPPLSASTPVSSRQTHRGRKSRGCLQWAAEDGAPGCGMMPSDVMKLPDSGKGCTAVGALTTRGHTLPKTELYGVGILANKRLQKEQARGVGLAGAPCTLRKQDHPKLCQLQNKGHEGSMHKTTSFHNLVHNPRATTCAPRSPGAESLCPERPTRRQGAPLPAQSSHSNTQVKGSRAQDTPAFTAPLCACPSWGSTQPQPSHPRAGAQREGALHPQ